MDFIDRTQVHVMKLHEILLIVWPFSRDPRPVTRRKQCGKNQTLNRTMVKKNPQMTQDTQSGGQILPT